MDIIAIGFIGNFPPGDEHQDANLPEEQCGKQDS